MKSMVRIGIIGQSESLNEPLKESVRETAYKIGFLIAKKGWLLINGGRNGVMRASSRGAKDAGGITIGILPSMDKEEANEFVDIPITTGMGIGMRSELMIHTVDVVIMIGGKNGTLKELSAAYLNRKPIVILRRTDGFADTIQKILYRGRYLDSRKNIEILFADTPEEAIQLVEKILESKA